MMPTLTTAQRAELRRLVHTPSIIGEQVADLWRSPAMVNGKIGPPVLTYSAIPIRIRPVGDAPKLIALTQPLNAARLSHQGKVAAGTDVRVGDEWRVGATKYKTEGVGAWENATLLALSEVKAQT